MRLREAVVVSLSDLERMMKTCTKCGEEKPRTRDNFYFRHGKWSARCLECSREISRLGMQRFRSTQRGQERNRQQSTACHKRRPEIGRAAGQNRRTNKLKADGSHSSQDVRDLYEASAGKCAYCGEDVGDNYHVDHIHPLSRGGSNGPENLAIACPGCNLSKGDKTLQEWKP
jgi:5-methylcytosine-specific restriction endonuclease McrA